MEANSSSIGSNQPTHQLKLFQLIDQQGQDKKYDALKKFLGNHPDSSNDKKRIQFREVSKILGDSKILQVISAAITKEPQSSLSLSLSSQPLAAPSINPIKPSQAVKQATKIEEANDRKNKIVNYLFRIRRPAGASLSRLAQFKHDYDTPWKHAGQNNITSNNHKEKNKNKNHKTDGSYSPSSSLSDSIDIAAQLAQRMKRSHTNWNALSARGNILSSAEGLLKADIDRGMSQGLSSIQTQYKYTLEQAQESYSMNDTDKKQLQLKYLLKQTDKTKGSEKGYIDRDNNNNDKQKEMYGCSGKLSSVRVGTDGIEKSQKYSRNTNTTSRIQSLVNDRYASIEEQEQLLRDVLIKQKHQDFKKIKDKQINNNNNNSPIRNSNMAKQQSNQINNSSNINSASRINVVLQNIHNHHSDSNPKNMMSLHQQQGHYNGALKGIDNHKSNELELIQPFHQRSISCNSNVNTNSANNTTAFSLSNTINNPIPNCNISVINRNRNLNRSAYCHTSMNTKRDTLDTSLNQSISPRTLLLHQNQDKLSIKKLKNLQWQESKEKEQQQQYSAVSGRLNSTDKLSSTLKQQSLQKRQDNDGQSSKQGIYVQPFQIKQGQQEQSDISYKDTTNGIATQNNLAILNTSNIKIDPFQRIQVDLIRKDKNKISNENSQSDSKVNYLNSFSIGKQKQLQQQYKYSDQQSSRPQYCYTDCSDSARLSTLDTDIHLNNRDTSRYLKSSISSVQQFESIQFLEKQQEQLVKDIESIKQVQEQQQHEQEHMQQVQEKQLEKQQQLSRQDISRSCGAMKHWSSSCETQRIKEVSKFIKSSQQQLRNIMDCCSARTPNEQKNILHLKRSASSASSTSNDSNNNDQGNNEKQNRSQEPLEEVNITRRAQTEGNSLESQYQLQSQKHHSTHQLKEQIRQTQWNGLSESRCMRTSQLRRKLNKERQKARLFILSQERDIDAYAHMPTHVNMIFQ